MNIKMRIKYPNHFETRVIEKFAWFPITITSAGFKKETRWFEKVLIKQYYIINRYQSKWVNECFLN
jgi:hypothetical protein